ncbi:MAG: hypothetical protein JNM43_28960 [Planctomycetaceae bacterium]|nr:hypothetical protein [Planctomycetaceae bacterium]
MTLIPAYIMVPSEGELVLCWGFDAIAVPFYGTPGRRTGGVWVLDDPKTRLGTVISWQYPDGKLAIEPRRTPPGVVE